MKAPSDHMRTLQRRVDFLKSRDHKNSFDLAELGALEWAFVNLQPQRQWVGLTDEERMDCIFATNWSKKPLMDTAKLIEVKLKEKNT
jgi:hypothetical protein